MLKILSSKEKHWFVHNKGMIARRIFVLCYYVRTGGCRDTQENIILATTVEEILNSTAYSTIQT